MFDEVTKREGGKRAARKGAYLFGSTAFQVAFIAALIVVSERIRAHVADGPIVDVKFVKMAAPPPPPPPPRKRVAPKPPSDAPKPIPPPPQAMIQPKEVQEEIKLPDANTPPEPEPDYGGDEGSAGGGVVGGVVGAGGGIEEAPQYATAGWRPPAMKQRGCVQSSIRIPRELQGYVTNVTVKFGIKPNGQPYAFSVPGSEPDQRITNAIWQAITGCDWTPGADAQGKPVAIWVHLPLKFQQ